MLLLVLVLSVQKKNKKLFAEKFMKDIHTFMSDIVVFIVHDYALKLRGCRMGRSQVIEIKGEDLTDDEYKAIFGKSKPNKKKDKKSRKKKVKNLSSRLRSKIERM